MMADWIGEVWLAAFATFITVFAFYLMNEVKGFGVWGLGLGLGFKGVVVVSESDRR